MLSYNIKLPEQGCNVFYGTYIDNYRNNIRTRYYIYDSQLIASTTSSYTNMPTGYICMSEDSLVYKPELEVYFTFMSIAAMLALFWLAYRFILHPFWRKS